MAPAPAFDFYAAVAAFGILFRLQIANLDVALSFWFFRCLPLFLHMGVLPVDSVDYKVNGGSRSS
jgi:hypothetical protein